jgi:integrase
MVRYRDAAGRQRKPKFATLGEAQRFEARLRLTPEKRAELEARSLTVGKLMATWLATKANLRPKTLDAYRLDAREVTDEFGHRLAASVQPSEVRMWIARDRGTSYVRRSLVAMSAAYEVAMADGLLDRNPTVGIKPPKASKGQRRSITFDVLGALARESGQWAPLIWLLGTTGLRVGEAAAIRVGDVDVARRRILVRQAVTYASTGAVVDTPKNHQIREVPVSPGVLDMLPLEGRSPDEWLWVGPRGDRLDVPSWRRQVFQEACVRAGLGKVTVTVENGKRSRTYSGLVPHELRHTAASIAIGDGADVVTVQAMLGHADMATTSIYAHAFQTAIDDVGARMQRRMQSRPVELESGTE